MAFLLDILVGVFHWYFPILLSFTCLLLSLSSAYFGLISYPVFSSLLFFIMCFWSAFPIRCCLRSLGCVLPCQFLWLSYFLSNPVLILSSVSQMYTFWLSLHFLPVHPLIPFPFTYYVKQVDTVRECDCWSPQCGNSLHGIVHIEASRKKRTQRDCDGWLSRPICGRPGSIRTDKLSTSGSDKRKQINLKPKILKILNGVGMFQIETWLACFKWHFYRSLQMQQ